jgi:hypothetical protein
MPLKEENLAFNMGEDEVCAIDLRKWFAAKKKFENQTWQQCRYYIVIGRIPGQHEDTAVIVYTVSSKAAQRGFERWIWANAGYGLSRRRVKELFGDTIYINYIFSTKEKPSGVFAREDAGFAIGLFPRNSED